MLIVTDRSGILREDRETDEMDETLRRRVCRNVSSATRRRLSRGLQSKEGTEGRWKSVSRV